MFGPEGFPRIAGLRAPTWRPVWVGAETEASLAFCRPGSRSVPAPRGGLYRSERPILSLPRLTADKAEAQRGSATLSGRVSSFQNSCCLFLTRLTERFVLGVDMFIETLWKVWMELLDVLGLDVSNLSQYFSPASVANSPARALLLVGVVLLAYWFLSLTLGFTFSLLHVVFGRFFWIARVILFSMSCVYVLHKYEGEPENAVLPLCFVVAIYFMTGPMGFYWRSSPSGPSVEEKLEHLENQVRLLNIRLNKVLESLDRTNGK
uniref:BRI3 binding protein n=1 Tax=Panthera tigris altaica TaxID=74533 RepID=A0A8C9MD08_PANTA